MWGLKHKKRMKDILLRQNSKNNIIISTCRELNDVISINVIFNYYNNPMMHVLIVTGREE